MLELGKERDGRKCEGDRETKRSLLLAIAVPTRQSGLCSALTTYPLSISLSLFLPLSPPISLYTPVTDLDSNNFSPFISVPSVSSCYILLSSNKVLKRYTRSIPSADICPSPVSTLSSCPFSFINSISLLRLL